MNKKILKFLELLDNYRSTGEVLRLTDDYEKEVDIELSKTITELKTNNIDYKDIAIRTAADFDNYKKRINKERDDIINTANKNIILKLIDIVDDFELAESTVTFKSDENDKFTNYHTGIKFIYQKLIKLLSDENCEKITIDTNGKTKFDPYMHEAIGIDIKPEIESGYITSVMQNGWLLNNKLLRPAKVFVQN